MAAKSKLSMKISLKIENNAITKYFLINVHYMALLYTIIYLIAKCICIALFIT